MRTHALALERRAALGGPDGVLPDELFHGVAAEAAVSVACKQRLVVVGRPFFQPSIEHLDGVRSERGGALPTTLAAALDVSGEIDCDVAAFEAGQFRHPQTGLHGQEQQGPIPPSLPGREVGCGKKRHDFLFVEILDHALFVPFVGHGQHLLAVVEELRLVAGNVGEERPDGGQPGVAAADAVVAPGLEVVEEVPDHCSIDVSDRQVGWCPPEPTGRELQQQPEGVAVAGQRVGAGAKLTCQSVGEECLHMWRQRVNGHSASPSLNGCPDRALTSARSSGTASMYQ